MKSKCYILGLITLLIFMHVPTEAQFLKKLKNKITGKSESEDEDNKDSKTSSSTKYQPGDQIEVMIGGSTQQATISEEGFKNGFYYVRLQGGNELTIRPNQIIEAPNPDEMVFAVGDSIGLLNGSFVISGKVTNYSNQNKLYQIEAKRWDGSPYKASVLKEKLVAYWPYSDFYGAFSRYLNTQGTKAFYDLLSMHCGDCYPGSSRVLYEGDVPVAREQVVAISNILSKFPKTFDNGQTSYKTNPHFITQTIAHADQILSSGSEKAISEYLKRQYSIPSPNDFNYKQLRDDEDKVMFWKDEVMCGNPSGIKKYIAAEIDRYIQENNLKGSSADYLKDWDQEILKVRDKYKKEYDKPVNWTQQYRYTDPNAAAIVKRDLVRDAKKVLFYKNTLSTDKNNLGIPEGRKKSGVAFYQEPNCEYWVYVRFLYYEDYLGGGRYGSGKALFTEKGFTKPF